MARVASQAMDALPPLRQEQVLEALASDATRRLLAQCVRRAYAVKDLGEQTGLPLASCYRHVHRLLELQLLVVERSAMTADGKPYDLYRSRVRRARLEVAAGGVQVEWELNAPVEERLMGLWNDLRN